MMFGGHLLSVVIWLPVVGGFLVLALGNERVREAKWASLAVSVLAFALSRIILRRQRSAAPPQRSSHDWPARTPPAWPLP